MNFMMEKGRRKIVVMNFPYRKKKCLGIYDFHDNAYVKVATFNNDHSAEEFIEYLADMMGVERKENGKSD